MQLIMFVLPTTTTTYTIHSNTNINTNINVLQRGWTALLQAARNNHLAIALLLLERGAMNTDATDEVGWSVVYIRMHFSYIHIHTYILTYIHT